MSIVMFRLSRLCATSVLSLAVIVGLCAGCVSLYPEEVQYTPLETAVLRDDLATVQRLLDEGADPTEATPLHGPFDIAVGRGNLKIIQVLLDHGAADVPPQRGLGSYFAYLAIRRPMDDDANDFAVAQLLVEAGLDPCVRLKGLELDGMLPSEVAGKEGRPDLADGLRGLEVNCSGG